MACPGSLAMEQGLPDTSSAYADEGTAAHFLASTCLELGRHPATYLGSVIVVGANDNNEFDGAVWADTVTEDFTPRGEYKVDAEMASHVNHYVQAVRKQAEGGTQLVEQRIPITAYTGEPDASGTADAIVITPDGELQVHDLKYGMTPVSAEENKQLMLYALGAVDEYSIATEIRSVRLFIHQPRVQPPGSEWSCDLDMLQSFGQQVKERSFHALQVLNIEDPAAYIHHLRPSDDACRWCKAKALCPKLGAFVAETVGAEFDDITEMTEPEAKDTVSGYSPDELSGKMAAIPVIEKWIKAVRGAVEAALLAGESVPGYKLVAGKKGARAWVDAAEAEKVLKTMRLKTEEMYDMSLISPPQVEKIFGPKGRAPSVKRWNKLQALITQKDGQPSVATASDSRPALVIDHAAAFDDETGEDLA